MGLFLAFFFIFKRGGELSEVGRDRGLGSGEAHAVGLGGCQAEARRAGKIVCSNA